MTDFPEPMADAAFIGPLGATVLALEAQVETCREALLIETLVFFGNAIGRTAYFQVSRSRHYANEYVVLLGNSSRARKGTVRDVAVDLVSFADQGWADDAVISGAGSGEGIIAAVRDRQTRRRKAKKKEKEDLDLTHEIDADGYITEEIDPGVGDKRRVFDEGELSAVFKVATREGNTVSERLRTLYDSGAGQIVNKNSPMKATNAHVSVNGHITREEIRLRLTELDAANGWANRFVYCATRRVRRLPGGTITDEALYDLTQPLGHAIAWAREHEPRMSWEPSAWQRWKAFYNGVSDDVVGMVGALTARSEAHVLRLALTFAVADRVERVRLEHLEAALSVWDYCARSVAWVWADALGHPDADRILGALRDAGAAGLSRTSIRDLFSHDKRSTAIDATLALLADRRLAEARMVPTAGRSAEWWWLSDTVPTGTERDQRDGKAGFGPIGPDPSRSGPPENNGQVDARQAVHSEPPDLSDPPCREPEHRASDWAMPNATTWICGICHPTPAPVARTVIHRHPTTRNRRSA
jgi:hypothetical protein